MARASPIQNNFNSGEFSPLLQARTDSDRYKAGLALSRNAIPTLQGPEIRRSGSKFVAEVKQSNRPTIIIPFKYSNSESYILELGEGYMRFYTSREQLQSGMVAYDIFAPYISDNFSQLKWVQSLDVLYFVHPLIPPKKLVRFGATDWAFQNVDFKDGPYEKVGLPFFITQVTSVKRVATIAIGAATGVTTLSAKTGDYAAYAISTIVNDGFGACRITLPEADDFSDRSTVFINGATGTTGANGTWRVDKKGTTDYVLIGSTFNAAYTGGGQICPAPFNTILDLDKVFRMKIAGNAWGYGKIVGVTDGANALIQVIRSFGVAGSSPNFRFGLYGTDNGYPAACVFHDDRLYFGGPPVFSQRLDGSNVGDYENFAPSDYDTPGTVLASNAVSFSLNTGDANAIEWMQSDEYGMPVGTSGGTFVMRASSLNEAITPTNISVKRVDNVPVKDAMSVYAGKSTIYISSSTRKVYELTYYYNIDGFRKIDLSEIANHLPGNGISTNIVFQSSPQPIVWCGRADGVFMGIVYDRNLDTLRTGFSSHVLGGVGDASGNPPVIECFAVIPSPDGTVDDVWMVVKRYINGQTVRYIEYLDKIFEEFDAVENYQGSDCGATFDDPKTVTGITSANPAVAHVVGHGFTTGNHVKFKDVVGLKTNAGGDAINGTEFTITVTDVDHFSIDGLDSTALTAYVAGGEVRKQVSTISGLTWLEGETVAIFGDGLPLSNEVVTAGAVTLSQRAGVVQIGIPYDMKIKQLRLDAGAADGTSFGKNRRINEVALMVDRTYDFEIGMDFDNMVPVDVSENDDFRDQDGPLFTGILGRIQVDSNYDFQNQLCFKVSTPTPFSLLAIMPQQTAYDKG